MRYNKDVAMAASPLDGPVVLVRSGRVCQRPAGPLFARVPAQTLRLFRVEPYPVVSVLRKPVGGAPVRNLLPLGFLSPNICS